MYQSETDAVDLDGPLCGIAKLTESSRLWLCFSRPLKEFLTGSPTCDTSAATPFSFQSHQKLTIKGNKPITNQNGESITLLVLQTNHHKLWHATMSKLTLVPRSVSFVQGPGSVQNTDTLKRRSLEKLGCFSVAFHNMLHNLKFFGQCSRAMFHNVRFSWTALQNNPWVLTLALRLK